MDHRPLAAILLALAAAPAGAGQIRPIRTPTGTSEIAPLVPGLQAPPLNLPRLDTDPSPGAPAVASSSPELAPPESGLTPLAPAPAIGPISGQAASLELPPAARETLPPDPAQVNGSDDPQSSPEPAETAGMPGLVERLADDLGPLSFLPPGRAAELLQWYYERQPARAPDPEPTLAQDPEPQPPTRQGWGRALADAARRALGLKRPPAAPAAPDPDAALSPEIRFLNRQGAVRLFFGRGNGLGHQSATLSLARRLRALGFRGEIDAVYDEPLANSAREPIWGHMAEKLGVLIPEFDPRDPADQRIARLGMTVRSFESFRRDPFQVALALTGGMDSQRSPEFMSARAFLHLRPYGWNAYDNRLLLRGRTVPEAVLPDRPLVYAPSSRADTAAALEALPATKYPPARAAGLKALHGALATHDVLPVYGLAFFNARMLHRLLLGLAAATRERPDLLRGRGIVVPLLMDVPELLQNFTRLAENPFPFLRGRLRKGRLERVTPASRHLMNRLRTISVDDPGLPRALERLGPEEILLVRTGPVPPPLFEGLLAESTLPAVIEGKSAQTLARLLGAPALPLDGSMLEGFPDRGESAPALYAGPSRTLPVWSALSDGDDEHPFERIAAYLQAALEPGSGLRAYFAAGRVRQDDHGSDPLLLGLRALMRSGGR